MLEYNFNQMDGGIFMSYEEFKDYIDSAKKVNKNTYDKLVEKLGEEKVVLYFETYINDQTVEDDINKINRTSYYIEKCNEELIDVEFNE